MKCPLCKTEMQIDRVYTSVEGDESPDTETKVYKVVELKCRSKQCSNYGKVVETIRYPQELIKEE